MRTEGRARRRGGWGWAVLPLLLAGAGGQAQPPIPPPSPTMLPGDHGPLPLAVMLQPPGSHGGGPPPVETTPAPPSAAAIRAAQVAVDRCMTQGARIGAAVTDAAGHLRAAASADQAGGGAVFIAARKAAAAAAYGVPTSVVIERLRHDPSSIAAPKAYMAVSPGAVPLIVRGQVIGAIGASGGVGQQDEGCVVAAAEAIRPLLEGDRR